MQRSLDCNGLFCCPAAVDSSLCVHILALPVQDSTWLGLLAVVVIPLQLSVVTVAFEATATLEDLLGRCSSSAVVLQLVCQLHGL